VSGPFQVRLEVRSYELDIQGHVTTSAYLQYADHTRWKLLEAAGVDLEEMRRTGVGPVTLETTVRFVRELRLGHEVDVSCVFDWPGGRTGRVTQQLCRADDGDLVAELRSVGGILDLTARKLVPDPGAVWRRLARQPELLGLRSGGRS
jgi:acyl-CoA thioester hydrolase